MGLMIFAKNPAPGPGFCGIDRVFVFPNFVGGEWSNEWC